VPTISTDTDGDGLPNQTDSCAAAPNSGIDIDQDGIDDTCDPLISLPPPVNNNPGPPASQPSDPPAITPPNPTPIAPAEPATTSVIQPTITPSDDQTIVPKSESPQVPQSRIVTTSTTATPISAPSVLNTTSPEVKAAPLTSASIRSATETKQLARLVQVRTVPKVQRLTWLWWGGVVATLWLFLLLVMLISSYLDKLRRRFRQTA
jgi:hypothetical protein